MNIVTARVLSESSSLKRIAWAFGCAKKGSEDEQYLHDALVRKIAEAFTDAELRAARIPPPFTPFPASNASAAQPPPEVAPALSVQPQDVSPSIKQGEE